VRRLRRGVQGKNDQRQRHQRGGQGRQGTEQRVLVVAHHRAGDGGQREREAPEHDERGAHVEAAGVAGDPPAGDADDSRAEEQRRRQDAEEPGQVVGRPGRRLSEDGDRGRADRAHGHRDRRARQHASNRQHAVGPALVARRTALRRGPQSPDDA
jgi:hypothetical protein